MQSLLISIPVNEEIIRFFVQKLFIAFKLSPPPHPISQTEISGSVKSFEDYLKNPAQRDVYTNVLYGVLQSYDLMDLVGISGKGRIRFTD